MKNFILILALLLTMVPVYGESQTLIMTQEEYIIGDAITLTGSGIQALSVQIKVTDMNNLTLYNIDQFPVINGTIDYTFFMPIFAEEGEYKITTSLGQILFFKLIESGVDHEMSLTKDEYEVGAPITLLGSKIKTSSVQIKVTDLAALTLYNIDQIPVVNEAIDYSFFMPSFAKEGQYKLVTSLGDELIFEMKLKENNSNPDPTPVAPEPVGYVITLNEAVVELDLEEGNFFDLKATLNAGSQAVVWSSSDEDIATVDSTGRVTPVGPGTVIITAKRLNGTETNTAEVTVFLVEEEETPLGAINFSLPYVLGFPDGTFRADEGITRAQMATIYARLLQSSEMSQEVFKDVSSTNWAYKDIQKVRLVGIFSGYADGTFKPNQVLTNGELAATFSKFWSIKNIDVSDEAVEYAYNSHWASKHIFKMYNSQLISSLDNFNPEGMVTRGTVVQMINDLIGRKSIETVTSKFEDVTGDLIGEIEAASQILID